MAPNRAATSRYKHVQPRSADRERAGRIEIANISFSR